MRSFDRQWIFNDPRLIALERPALWASLSDEQVFLTTMTTTELGQGPAATLTTAVPDKHHFRGSYGGKDIIPLYRDTTRTPNADPTLLKAITEAHQAADPAAREVTVERLFAYAFGVLAGADYRERFAEGLETPGPRVPITADPTLFDRMVAHGTRLIGLQTFGERFDRSPLPTSGIAWAPAPTRLPDGRPDVVFDRASETLRVADGLLTGVTADVWDFSVSGMAVVAKWLEKRMVAPAGRARSSTSPLDHMRPNAWVSEWSTELVEIVAAINETLALQPAGIALLDQIVAGPLLSVADLPEPPAARTALREPPSVRRGQSDGALF
jgi:hypothetical protein